MIRTIASSLVLAVLFAALPAGAAANKVPAVGASAPDFTLDSQEGKPVSLRDFHGKWVVLYFYPKDFTHGCTIEAHNFQRDLTRYEALGATILGVSMQSPDSHKVFCAKEGLNFKLLSDAKGAVSASYGSVINLAVTKLSSRNTFLIGPDGVIAKEFVKVSPEGHSEEVLAALTQLQKRPDAK